MKKFPLKVSYGILATLELGMHFGSTPTQARVIAQRQNIPVRFIEQVLHALKHAGVVESLRGAQGGYSLAKDPSRLSLAEVVQAMEGSGASPSFKNVEGSGGSFQPRHQEALLSSIWEQVHKVEQEFLESITIKSLAEQFGQLEQDRALMYHI